MPEAHAPLAFAPLLKERVWGGHALSERFGKQAQSAEPIGESWELVDRPGEQSVVDGGPLAGTELHDLWTERREEIFGRRALGAGDRFPLIIKLLDAAQTLSVQVHPPSWIAPRLGGEPKTEMWVILEADDDARLYAGLRSGVTREGFAEALTAGEDVSKLLHSIEVQAGDVLSIPSGRVHAIGAGCLIAEIQQNSDTTYRVFDFNRPGLDGEPRELHVERSMESIDWDDVEPSLAQPDGELLVRTDHFTTYRWTLGHNRRATTPGECAIVICAKGSVTCGDRDFTEGELFLVPASPYELTVAPGTADAEVLVVELPD